MHTRCNDCVAISVRGNQDEDAVEGLLSTEAFPQCVRWRGEGGKGAEAWGEEGRWVPTASSGRDAPTSLALSAWLSRSV